MTISDSSKVSFIDVPNEITFSTLANAPFTSREFGIEYTKSTPLIITVST